MKKLNSDEVICDNCEGTGRITWIQNIFGPDKVKGLRLLWLTEEEIKKLNVQTEIKHEGL